jgi:AraC-like DNA-binding protein
VAARYLPTRTNAFEFRFVETNSEGALIVEELCDLGESREAIVSALIVGMARFVTVASYPAKIQGSLDFAFKRPDYAARLLSSRLKDVAIRFDPPQHALRCDAAALSIRLRNADPEALAMARGQCEVEMTALGIGDEIVPKVRAVVSHPQGGYRPLPSVARQLGLSARTLKRRLAAEGTSFSVIIDERRAEAARLMVLTDGTSLDEIAAQLGYSHTSAFSKAFRRWTGLTPREFRNRASTSR